MSDTEINARLEMIERNVLWLTAEVCRQILARQPAVIMELEIRLQHEMRELTRLVQEIDR